VVSLFVKRFLWVLIPVLTIVIAISLMADAGYRRSRTDEFSVWNDIYDGKINADLLFIGGSRAFVEISPAIEDSILGTHSYNLGMNGWPFRMEYARLRVYFQHNRKPKYIIIALGQTTLEDNRDLYGYVQFFPYLRDPIIREAVKGYNGEPGRWDAWIPFIKYCRNQDFAYAGCMNYLLYLMGQRKEDRIRGYKGQDLPWDGAFDSFASTVPLHSIETIPDSASLHTFGNFLAYCGKEDIHVLLVYPPEYHPVFSYYKNREDIMTLYEKYARQSSIPFLNFSENTISYQKRYFYNSQHLNKMGSEIFSRELGDSLRQYIR
jgi:hypothetical protein